jgi:hypothetical protein
MGAGTSHSVSRFFLEFGDYQCEGTSVCEIVCAIAHTN